MPEKIFGITAAHCVPAGLVGYPICSPSAVEVTARFWRILGYTSLSIPKEHVCTISARDVEAQSIIEEFRFHDSTDGPTFINPANAAEVKQGTFSGARLGLIEHRHFEVHSGLLHSYDEELRQRELGSFSAHVSWMTRVDFCIFSCDPER